MSRSVTIGIAAAIVLSLAMAANGAADKIVWKPLEQAIISVGGKAPPIWNIYSGDKQGQLLLLQLWKRYLFVDRKEGVVYDIDPKTLSKKGANFELLRAAIPAKPLAISEWAVKDMGVTTRLRFKIGADGRLIEIQLPHAPDMRSLY